MKQSFLESFVEAFVNTSTGFLTAFIINWAVSTAYGMQIPTAENTLLVVTFTLWSFLRQFLIRRVFASERIRVQVYHGWLRWKLRNEDDNICCCGGDERDCGYGCLPASFVSQKWYVIDKRMTEKFGSGWNQHTTKRRKRRATGNRNP